jgi:hypothetical protein
VYISILNRTSNVVIIIAAMTHPKSLNMNRLYTKQHWLSEFTGHPDKENLYPEQTFLPMGII